MAAPLPLLLLIFILSYSLYYLSDSIRGVKGVGVGINYGQIANNLPTPTRVATLLQDIEVTRVKLYDADPNVLQAFSGTGVEFIICLGNEYLPNMSNPNMAQSWILTNVQPFLSRTNITTITVGNEILTGNDTLLMSYLLPAMQSVYAALSNLGLNQRVTVTSAHSAGILSNSYPPSSGTFQPDLAQYIQPLLNFHSMIKSPFLINVYPFFAYKDNPEQVSLEYVLFQSNPGMTDPNTDLHYDNMLYAQVDAVYAAMKAMGHTDIEILISETGWPSKGDPDEVGASLENAKAYNGNLLQRIERKEGTPGRPSVPINVFVFALFNEDLKPGPASERNYGLYYPDGTPVYDIGLQGYLPSMSLSATASHKKSMGLCILSLFSIITFILLVIYA
ncbi:hypothetical protein Dimus_009372 [Dionaea muscipula]